MITVKDNLIRPKFKKLHEDAVLPAGAHEGDVGLDVTAIDDGIIYEEYVQYKTGLAMEIPTGYVALLFPRSSITKHNLMLKNSVGVIDSGYRGEIVARFQLARPFDTHIRYKKGDRIAQLIIMPYPMAIPEWADELEDSDRGVGGFGSTGN